MQFFFALFGLNEHIPLVLMGKKSKFIKNIGSLTLFYSLEDYGILLCYYTDSITRIGTQEKDILTMGVKNE